MDRGSVEQVMTDPFGFPFASLRALNVSIKQSSDVSTTCPLSLLAPGGRAPSPDGVGVLVLAGEALKKLIANDE